MLINQKDDSWWETLKGLMLMKAAAGGGMSEYEVTGNPAAFNTNVAKPLRQLLIPFAPVQDLHGYDAPWPAGGGKNKFQTTAESKTENGVTWTVNADGSVTVSGTASGYSGLDVGKADISGISGDVTVGRNLDETTNVAWANISLTDENNTVLYTITSGSASIASYTVNLSEYPTAKWIKVSIKRNNNSATSGTIKIQVVAGNSVAAWSPYSNICHITGRTGLNVTANGTTIPVIFPALGKNLCDPTKRTSTSASINRWYESEGLLLKKGETYTLSSYPATNTAVYFIDFQSGISIKGGHGTETYTPTEDIRVFLQLYKASGILDVELQLEKGSTATSYKPFDNTAYCGTLDLTTGELTVTHGITDLGTKAWSKSNASWYHENENFNGKNDANGEHLFCTQYKGGDAYTGNTDLVVSTRVGTYRRIWICDKSKNNMTYSEFKTAMSGVMLVYELAEPLEFQLTPQQVSTLIGDNVVYSDTNGENTVVYLKRG